MTSAWGDSETSYFYAITPDLVLSAVEDLGFVCTGRVLTLNSMENRVFEVQIDTEPLSQIIIKFYRPQRWTKEQILEEHEFLFDLQAEQIEVIAPSKIDGVSLFHEKQSKIMYAIFPKARGRNPQELNDQDLMQVGRLLGRLHMVSKRKQMQHRMVLTPELYLLKNLESVQSSGYLPHECNNEYSDLIHKIYNLIAKHFDPSTYIRLHGDAHLGNLIWFDSVAAWLDFDDSLMGPPIQDLWLLASGRDLEDKIRMDLLVEEYELFSKFDRSSLKLIEPLRTMRMVHFSAWISKRWLDPAFPAAFPQFGTSYYWQEQLQILREQDQILSQTF